MSEKIFLNQALSITLAAKDNDGDVLNLAGKTMHFLSCDPVGVVTIDTTPTVVDAAGTVTHVYAVNDLNKAGAWLVKVLVDSDEIPSTKYLFQVYDRWGA